MKINGKITVFFAGYCIGLLLFLSAANSFAASEAPIHIAADHMTSTENKNSVVFTGDVDAKQDDVRIRSDKMTVFYTEKEGGKKKSKGQKGSQQVEKLICVGNVEITRAEWLGTSKEMVYLSKERQVILTGNAKAWQDQNMVSGDKIIYYLDEGRSEVVGETTAAAAAKSGDKTSSRVNMTIMQN